MFNPMWPGGGGLIVTVTLSHCHCHIFAYICANTRTSALKKLDFSQLWVWKRAVHFYPVKLSRFAEKNKVRWKKQNFIRGDPYKSGETPLWRTKKSKSNIVLEGGSGHPNFMNPYEYGKSFLRKLFPKRIGTLTPPRPKIFRGDPRIPDTSK